MAHRLSPTLLPMAASPSPNASASVSPQARLRSRSQIKDSLLFEKKKIEAALERRKNKDHKKYSKKVQVAKGAFAGAD